MKFTVPRNSFLDALKTVQPAVARRSTLPILSGVWMNATEAGLEVEATDLESTISTRPDGVNVSERGEAVVPASALTKAVRAMGDAELEVAAESADGRSKLTLRSGSRTVAVHGFACEDWPRMPAATTDPVAVVDAGSLADALGRVAMCASTDEARPVLTGVALIVDAKGKAMEVVATDSYRLGGISVHIARFGSCPGQPPIVPARTARSLAKHLKGARGTVALHIESGDAGTHAVFTHGDDVWAMRCLEGSFPDWRQILADQGGACVVFEADEVASALKTMAAVRSNGTPVRVSLGHRCMIALSEKDVGEVTESLDSARYTADGVGDIEVGFNLDYLADAIRFLGTHRPEARIRSALKPAIFIHARRRYALMPVRLS